MLILSFCFLLVVSFCAIIHFSLFCTISRYFSSFYHSINNFVSFATNLVVSKLLLIWFFMFSVLFLFCIFFTYFITGSDFLGSSTLSEC